MCGIAGIVAWDDRYRVTRETLARMSARIAHRGPDGEGLYLNHEGEARPDRPQVGLVHRRLAIIDPDPRANQPFGDEAGRQLVFNGEIYNYRELRTELKSLRPDYAWRTESDTEVLLLAYAVWGEKCVEHLNGMFAFAVWDERAGSLFLARDRMGQKPLYVRKAEGAIYFGSSLASIPQDDPPSSALYWLGDYLRYGTLVGFTPWMHTARFMPGQWWLVRPPNEPILGTYYDAGRLQSPPINDELAVGATRSLVERAVERQLVSDVPLGVLLSGGIDSSVIATAAGRLGPIKTFSARFDDPRYDESEFARAVAAHLRTDHHEFEITPAAAADLPEIASAFGEPFADSSAIPTYFLSRATRAQVKVVLSGDGGDELFGGYDRYRAIRWGSGVRALRLLRPIARPFAGGHPKSFAARLARQIATLGEPPGRRYDSYMRIFDERTLAKLIPEMPFLCPTVEEAFTISMWIHADVTTAALACDRMRYLPDDLLTKVDYASMAHALEVRSPFMDHELVTFAAGLTTDQLLKGGPKRMLREAFAADLPAWVFKRKKMGFAVPIGDWFRDRKGPVRAMLHDHLFAADAFGASHFQMATVRRLVEEHESGMVDHAQRLYALLMLELWWKGQAAKPE